MLEDALAPEANPFSSAPIAAASPALAPEWYSTAPPAKIYVVPKRFGLLAILVVTTVMGVLFGCLRFLDAPPSVFLFFGLMSLAICLVQMFYGDVPRKASVVTGAIVSPLIVIGVAAFDGGHWGLIICSSIIWVFLGGFVGYLMGTCAAGIFLVLEHVEPHLPGGRRQDRSNDKSIWSEMPGGNNERSVGEDAVPRRAGL